MTTQGIRALLDEVGFHPSPRMGQSFLVDGNQLDRIASEALAGDPGWILEIGAGPGNLTERLPGEGRDVLALERDRRLVAVCARRLGGRAGLHLLAGDALSLPLRRHLPAVARLHVVGNIPYGITGEIVRRVGEDLTWATRAVFLVQKEVAERLAAEPGNKAYGAFTILTRAKWNVSAGFTVPASCFWPRPDVDSRLVVLERPETPPIRPALYPLVRRLVTEAFQRRRKTLSNAIGPLFDQLRARGDVSVIILAAGLDPGQRPETVPLQAWEQMAIALRGAVQ